MSWAQNATLLLTLIVPRRRKYGKAKKFTTFSKTEELCLKATFLCSALKNKINFNFWWGLDFKFIETTYFKSSSFDSEFISICIIISYDFVDITIALLRLIWNVVHTNAHTLRTSFNWMMIEIDDNKIERATSVIKSAFWLSVNSSFMFLVLSLWKTTSVIIQLALCRKPAYAVWIKCTVTKETHKNN